MGWFAFLEALRSGVLLFLVRGGIQTSLLLPLWASNQSLKCSLGERGVCGQRALEFGSPSDRARNPKELLKFLGGPLIIYIGVPRRTHENQRKLVPGGFKVCGGGVGGGASFFRFLFYINFVDTGDTSVLAHSRSYQ